MIEEHDLAFFNFRTKRWEPAILGDTNRPYRDYIPQHHEDLDIYDSLILDGCDPATAFKIVGDSWEA